MTSHNHVVKQQVNFNEDAGYWFRYIENAVIINAWDTLCMSCNGADLDGDLLFTTNNKVLVENHRKLPPIDCIQKRASKIIPTENDIIISNKNGFGDKIGSTTNLTTSQISLQASFSPDSDEYKELEYRILCGQNYQQAAIDRIKGIFSRDMPKTWYVKAANRTNSDDSDEIIAKKQFYQRICSDKKPYFFMYNYSNLKTEYDRYFNDTDSSVKLRFGKNLNELLNSDDLTEEESDSIERFRKYSPLDMSPGTINRICWAIEREFDGDKFFEQIEFDKNILKSGADYNNTDYKKVEKIYHEYLSSLKSASRSSEDVDIQIITEFFGNECRLLGLEDDVLCDILIDMCYTSNKNKQLLWNYFGDIIVKNLLKNSNNTLKFPVLDEENGDFSFKGHNFSMHCINIDKEMNQ